MRDYKPPMALAGVAQLVGVSFCKQKGQMFDSWSGPMPGMQVWSLYGMYVRGSRSMFLSHIDVSLPLSPSLPLSLNSVSMSSGEDKQANK